MSEFPLLLEYLKEKGYRTFGDNAPFSTLFFPKGNAFPRTIVDLSEEDHIRISTIAHQGQKYRDWERYQPVNENQAIAYLRGLLS